MARISRIVVSNHPHHVTQRGVRSMEIFSDDEDRMAYLNFVAEETERFGVEILAWCLMSNHVHFIAVPRDESCLARGFGEAHRRFTRMKNFAEGVRGYLFQGRFSSCVLDERHLISAARYVELNPVRAGIVRHAWDYVWSSCQFHMGQKKNDILVRDGTMRGLVVDWRAFLEEGSKEESERVRLMTRTGRPEGNSSFINMIEMMTGCDLKKGKPGRPRKKT